MDPENTKEEAAAEGAEKEKAENKNKDMPVADEKDVKGGAIYMKFEGVDGR